MIGKRIAQLRENSGMSQKQLAEKLGVAQSMVAQMERGTKSVPAHHVEVLSELFSVSCDWIVKGDTESA